MKYRVKAFQHSEDSEWEAKYVLPEGEVRNGVVLTPNSIRLAKFFKTKKEADDYTIQHLKENGIKEDEIEVRE